MKKLNNRSGFTLMEMLVALAVLVILVMGMSATLSTAVRVYSDSIFESNSASLAGILNTSIGDILRYSEDVTLNNGSMKDSDGNPLQPTDVGFVFTNYEYGAIDAYFYTDLLEGGGSQGVLQLKNLLNTDKTELVNTGAYPNLEITNFSIVFVAPSGTSPKVEDGNYFTIAYDILDTEQARHTRHVEYIARRLRPM